LEGAWGDTVNNSVTSLLDTAIAGTTTLSADSDVTLSTTALASNQARQAIILWTASGTTTRYITAPAQSKTYVVINKSSTQSIVIRGVGPTTGVTVAAGTSAIVAWNGTDFSNAAGVSGIVGQRSTVYTTAGTFTFTIPTGVTNIKVTVVGAGGGGSASSGCLSVSGSAGGTSSVASGTQTISTISATGGAGGGFAGASVGGLGSGGDINNRGFSAYSMTLSGGSILSGGVTSTSTALSGAGGAGSGYWSGSGGGNAIKWLTGLTGGNTLAVTVGAGGAGGNAGAGAAGSGGAGVVIFEY